MNDKKVFDIKLFDAFQNEFAQMKTDFPFLSLKVLQKGDFSDLVTLRKTMYSIFTENSKIMKKFLDTHLPKTADEVNPMLVSLENKLNFGTGETVELDTIKKSSMGLVQSLIRSVIIKLYDTDLTDINTIKLSESITTSLDAIEKIAHKFSGTEFKLSPSENVDENYIKLYIHDVSKTHDVLRIQNVLGMLLKKYDEFPIIKRYIHLMYSIVTLPQHVTKDDTKVGGVPPVQFLQPMVTEHDVHQPVSHRPYAQPVSIQPYVQPVSVQPVSVQPPSAVAIDVLPSQHVSDALRYGYTTPATVATHFSIHPTTSSTELRRHNPNPRAAHIIHGPNSNQASQMYGVEEPITWFDKPLSTTFALTPFIIVGLSGIIFTLYKRSKMKDFFHNSHPIFILLYTISMLISYTLLILGFEKGYTWFFKKKKEYYSYNQYDVFGYGGRLLDDSDDSDDEDEGLDVSGGRDIVYADEPDVFSDNKLIFDMSIEEPRELSSENIKQFDQDVMNIYVENAHHIKKYFDSVPDIDVNLKNVVGSITTEITANPVIKYNADGSPKIGNLLNKSVRLMLLSVLKKFYYSSEPFILKNNDTTMLNSINYIAQKTIRKSKNAEPIQVSENEIDTFFQNSDDPEFAGKVEFISDLLFKKYSNQPIIQNYIILIKTVASSLAGISGGMYSVYANAKRDMPSITNWDQAQWWINKRENEMYELNKSAKSKHWTLWILFSITGLLFTYIVSKIRVVVFEYIYKKAREFVRKLLGKSGGDVKALETINVEKKNNEDKFIEGTGEGDNTLGIVTVTSLLFIKNIMLVVIIISLILLVYLSYSIYKKYDPTYDKLNQPSKCLSYVS